MTSSPSHAVREGGQGDYTHQEDGIGGRLSVWRARQEKKRVGGRSGSS